MTDILALKICVQLYILLRKKEGLYARGLLGGGSVCQGIARRDSVAK